MIEALGGAFLSKELHTEKTRQKQFDVGFS